MTHARTAPWCLVVGLFAAGPVAWGAEDLLSTLRDEARAEVTGAAKAHIKTDTVQGKGPARGRRVPRHTITLTTGEVDYTFEYVCARGDRARRLAQGGPLSELGMTAPSPANWYTGGFVDVVVDGLGLATLPGEVAPMRLPAGSAGVRLTWPHPKGTIGAALRTFSFDPFLYVVVDVPKARSRQVTLLCYPNAFHLPRDRWLTTPKRDIRHRKDLCEKLRGDEMDWILYSDRAADLIAASTTGPCALVLLPDQVAALELVMGRPERPGWPAKQNYGVITSLIPRAGVCRLCFALIDFPPMTWMQAKARLPQDVPRVQARLRELANREPS